VRESRLDRFPKSWDGQIKVPPSVAVHPVVVVGFFAPSLFDLSWRFCGKVRHFN